MNFQAGVDCGLLVTKTVFEFALVNLLVVVQCTDLVAGLF